MKCLPFCRWKILLYIWLPPNTIENSSQLFNLRHTFMWQSTSGDRGYISIYYRRVRQKGSELNWKLSHLQKGWRKKNQACQKCTENVLPLWKIKIAFTILIKYFQHESSPRSQHFHYNLQCKKNQKKTPVTCLCEISQVQKHQIL